MTDSAAFDQDIDTVETQEWLQAFRSLLNYEGVERAQFLVQKLIAEAEKNGINIGSQVTTDYVNTIATEKQPAYPGNIQIEDQLNRFLRWNAMAIVLRAGKRAPEVGGHIATFGSSALLYEVGLYHYFNSPSKTHGGDCVYIQGHSSPGIYAYAYLEGRITESQLDCYRQEVETDGLASYPHPWLMGDFWQFPTVSMGLGPLQAIYQARFLKYLHYRGLANTEKRRVWVYCGDGEMDEPESLGGLNIATKECLDNLIFVVNCNLQRLDGPVRGNGKIIQDLEGIFRGAGWNVIKVIWDHHWDELLAKDPQGILRQRMMEMIDGEYQYFKAKDPQQARALMFGGSDELKAIADSISDETLTAMLYGGHDREKINAAYHQAVNYDNGRPTVILAKTIKGYGMGDIGQGKNTTHQQKKLPIDDIKAFRDRFDIPITDENIAEIPYVKPQADSEVVQYLQQRRLALGGSFPIRRQYSNSLMIPPLSDFAQHLKSSDTREYSTTMAFVRILNTLLKNKQLKQHIVPIVPDESRTFGMEGMFRQLGIYSAVGQRYTPVDAEQLMFYKEDQKGQFLQEGITEAGGMCSWMAAATSYSTNNLPMIPFYIYYSMFGFQRIGDLAYAAGDMQARGFLLGATAGRTTLAGEGLQHQDGHSHILAATIPSCVSYDPTYSYELAVIIQDGLRRMYQEQENVFYYITVMNENYTHPEMPEGAQTGIIKGMYHLQSTDTRKHQVQLLGCGTILREVIAAAEILAADYDVSADIWSVTSFNELYREAWALERDHRFHPQQEQTDSYVYQCLAKQPGPIIAATDYMRAYAEQIRPYIGDKSYTVLGTDGYGRSDGRAKLRHFFEVDAKHIVAAVLKSLVDLQQLDTKVLVDAMNKLGIDAQKPNPVAVSGELNSDVILGDPEQLGLNTKPTADLG